MHNMFKIYSIVTLKIRFVSSANNIILSLLEIFVMSIILKIIVVLIPIFVEHHN